MLMKKTRTLRINKSKGTWGKGIFAGYTPTVHSCCSLHFFILTPSELARIHPGSQTSFSRDLNFYSRGLF